MLSRIAESLFWIGSHRLMEEKGAEANISRFKDYYDVPTRTYEGFEGGHIYKYDPKTGDAQRYRTDDATPLEDLGIPVAGDIGGHRHPQLGAAQR